MAFLWTKDRLYKKNFLRLAYLLASACFFIQTAIGRKVHRPYGYRNHIKDWGVADTMGNSLVALTQIFLYLGFAKATKVEGYRIIAFVTIGSVVYEVMQPILPRGTFDWKDIPATLVAGKLASISDTRIHFFFPEKNSSLKNTKAGA